MDECNPLPARQRADNGEGEGHGDERRGQRHGVAAQVEIETSL